MPSTPRRDGWQWTETVLAGATSDPLYMPERDNHKPATVGVSPGVGGTALVEYSLSSVAAVKAGTAIWRSWPYGDVSVDTDELLEGPVTALRMTATTADATWEVLT